MSHSDFAWSQLGDIQAGRPSLGSDTRVALYRLMHYTLREVLEKELGEGRMQSLFLQAGYQAGSEFCRHLLDTSLALGPFIDQMHARMLECSLGILKVEQADAEAMEFVVTVSEDLECSGLPGGAGSLGDYNEGFLQGIFEVYTGQAFLVEEVGWSNGESVCRFTIRQLP